ncbi:MAG: heavy metal translocating P-type ATPase [Oscillatoria sp. SIO1A7]|nr:heavy metal translocating P-type ATPase [Oscillatoria sp. SIO1A7]
MNRQALSFSNYLMLAKEYPEAAAAAACGVLVLLGWLALNLGWIGLALFILWSAYAIGGYESAREGLTTLWQEKEFDIDLLMIVAALGAACLGLWQRDYYLTVDGAVLILIFAISGALESFAMQRTDRNIRRLMAATPDTARVIQSDRESEVAVAKLEVGDLVLVKPGELIPIDGIILEGNSAINQASITGESLPAQKSIGDEVFAGTLNGSGALKLRVNKPPESNLIQRIVRLVEQAQTEQPPSQQFIERFERGYARFIVLAGLSIAIFPPLFLGWDWTSAIYRSLVFLVVASPCALMASIMPALLSAIANGARQGILFKNGAQIETIGRVKAIAFDKTGTLTSGKLKVVRVISSSGSSENLVLQLAAALESCSEHPIGEAIVLEARHNRQLDWPLATNVQARVGQGIVGDIEGKRIVVGKAAFVSGEVGGLHPELLKESDRLEAEGKTTVWVAANTENPDSNKSDKASGHILGLIAVADTPRSEAAETVRRLKELGIESIAMLTGDNEQTARSVAGAIGIEEVYAELLPEDKLAVIQRLQQKYKIVAMVGDGINDAPALARSSVGIAMGGAGTDVALETADIVLMGDRLEKLEPAIRLGRRANRIIKQNITLALSFIVLLLLANFAGFLNLSIGTIGHEGSTVLVTLSGLRLLKNVKSSRGEFLA